MATGADEAGDEVVVGRRNVSRVMTEIRGTMFETGSEDEWIGGAVLWVNGDGLPENAEGTTSIPPPEIAGLSARGGVGSSGVIGNGTTGVLGIGDRPLGGPAPAIPPTPTVAGDRPTGVRGESDFGIAVRADGLYGLVATSRDNNPAAVLHQKDSRAAQLRLEPYRSAEPQLKLPEEGRFGDLISVLFEPPPGTVDTHGRRLGGAEPLDVIAPRGASM